jgi:hypothetical protein
MKGIGHAAIEKVKQDAQNFAQRTTRDGANDAKTLMIMDNNEYSSNARKPMRDSRFAAARARGEGSHSRSASCVHSQAQCISVGHRGSGTECVITCRRRTAAI